MTRKFVCSISLFLASSTALFAQETPLQVVVDIPPTAALLAEYGWDANANIDVATLLEPNQSAHHFALTPEQIAVLDKADVVFGVGSIFLPEIVDAAQNLEDGPWVLFYDDNFLKGDLSEAMGQCDLETLGKDETPVFIQNNDPHIWLSTAHLKQMGDFMDCALAQISGQESRAQAVDLDVDVAVNSPVKLIASHDAFGYFEREQGIVSFGAFHDLNDQALPPRDFATVMNAITNGKIECLLVEAGGHSHDLEELAESHNLKEFEFDLLGWNMPAGTGFFYTYFDNLATIYQDCD